MTENLLEAPERGPIEAVLQKCNTGFSHAPTFERVLGFLTGAVITPAGYASWYWLQPLFEMNGIALCDLEEIDPFSATLLSLYDRVDAKRLRGEGLVPFDLNNPEVVPESAVVVDWAKGLHNALTVEEDIWIPYDDEAEEIDEDLKSEVNLNFQCLTTLVDPSSIPDIIKDPVPFQRSVLRECLGSINELRETWDDELKEMLKYFCIARLDSMIALFQRYAKVYRDTQIVVVDWSEVGQKSQTELKRNIRRCLTPLQGSRCGTAESNEAEVPVFTLP